MRERERMKERREARQRRERVTDRRRRGQVRPGGWWWLDPLLDPSSTSPLPNMGHRSGSTGSMFCGSRFASFLRSRSKAYACSSMVSLEFTLCPWKLKLAIMQAMAFS
ncbi:hypothetical protein CFC21_070823 [Triticum aestivum]|uniref:Uncharacterized protein n=2 Tax=Triticum aestivum TaxID=4565 RepID=A0A3B6LHI7_WHEAT|nr:hypothetical protein CFC21_070823 [Triticum aestivum]